ncbi:MAG: alginate export family protein [Bacteroidota bacterium]
MKKTINLLIFVLIVCLSQKASIAQEISIDGEFRINPVYSMGFRKPMYAGDKPGFFTMQRTRLILTYKKENDLEAEIIFQDRRFWGDQGDREDVANLALYRGWVEKHFKKGFSIRLGRQGLVYDDQYLLGDPNWVGTRAHDAGIVKYETNKLSVHLGFAFNANGQDLKREPYKYNMYKNLQFLWFHKDFKKVKLSFIGINRGMEKSDTTTNIYYTQTFGPDINVEITKKISLKGIFYYQVGQNTDKENVSAYFYSAQLKFELNKSVDFTLGLDVGSGTNQNDILDAKNKTSHSFDRHYGLIHGHFGYIDYFYVNQPTLCGIKDYYLKTKIKLTPKFSIEDHIHYFDTEAKINNSKNPGETMPNYLGTENDILLNYKFSDTFKASLGHSIMFGTPTLNEFFGGKKSVQNQVIYMVITATPNFLKIKK